MGGLSLLTPVTLVAFDLSEKSLLTGGSTLIPISCPFQTYP
jgi:hypothetical protein